MLRSLSLMTAVLMAGAMAVPAAACDGAALRTRLVGCGSESCVVVSGHRTSAASKVLINGHEVPASGHHRWTASVPVSTVRAWSAPHARTISVAVDDAVRDARLPVGLLSPKTDLAMLVVTVK